MRGLLPVAAFLLLHGCASSGPYWETKQAPADFVAGTRVLAEVTESITRAEVLSGQYAQPLTSGLHERLLAVGIADIEIVDGSEVGARTFCYGHNSVAGCVHQGFYNVHLPPRFRGKVNVQFDRHVRLRSRGDLIEVELRKTPTNQLVGILVGVYRTYDDWRDCQEESLIYKETASQALLSLSPYGPPGARWIECAGIEKEGWIRRPVLGAPPNGVPNKPVSQWFKLPPSAK
jgi:hypothetical protein